jgi:VWFA-related protein
MSRSLIPVLARFLLIALFASVPQGLSGQQPAPGPPIRVTVNVVNILATVRDSHGRIVPELTKDDFEVWEDGQKQEISFFSRESAEPLTLGLLVDTSISQERVLPAEQEAAARFLEQVVKSKDLVFVISFDVDVNLLQDFTNEVGRLERAIDRTVINAPFSPVAPGPFPSRPKGTRLHDAIYLAATEKLGSEAGRKALLILSDGEDAGSTTSLDQALEAAQRSDTVIYAVAMLDYNFYFRQGYHYSGDSVLKKTTEETGGRAISVKDPKKLSQAFAQIAEEMRSQYSLAYTPTNKKRDGSYRKVKIQIKRPGYKLLARRGYYAPKE